MFVVTLSVLITMIVFKARTNFVNMFTLAIVVCFCYLMATHFIDIHSNGAEALVTCYLTEDNCEAGEMISCPHDLWRDVEAFEEKYDLK